MVTFGLGITGANCRCSPVWCFGGGKFRWGPGTKPGPITGGTLGGGGSLGELGSSGGGGGTESGIGLAGGCGGNGGGVELVPPALVYDDRRCSSGNGFDGGVLLVVQHLVLSMDVVRLVEEFCMVDHLWQQQ